MAKLIDFEEKERNRIWKTLHSTKYDYLRMTHFGNSSSGTDMEKREKFLIVYGNWYSGEYGKFNSHFYPDRKNNNRLKVVKGLSEKMKEELQILLMREYLEYPLRSRRKLPTYCITDYFVETDKIAEKINAVILKDYNLDLVFF